MELLPSDGDDYICPTTRKQLKRLLEITNATARATPPPSNREDPGDARYIRRPRQLRPPKRVKSHGKPSLSKGLHSGEEANKMRQKRILRTGYATLTIQPTSGEDALFLHGLMEDAGKCLGYPEWFESYKAAVETRLASDRGELDEYDKRSIKHLLDNVSLRCHLETMAPLFQDETLPDRWHVPCSLSVVGRPMTHRHLELVFSLKWSDAFNPMQLRPCSGWQGECFLVDMHGRRPFELPPYRLLHDYMDTADVQRHDIRWHWGQPMCLVCRTKSLHFPLLTRKGREIESDDFSMYHDFDFVDVRPEFVMRLPRPCREKESGVSIQTQTLVVIAFTKALIPKEDGFDVSAVCKEI